MTTTTPIVWLAGPGPIAMVDDSHDDFDIASRMYARSHLENPFIHFESGTALMAYLDADSENQESSLALILMDLNMPGMDGIETTAAVRARPEFHTVPVVAMLTSSVDPRDRVRAEDVGVTAYFPKPMRPTDYIEMFNSLQT